MTLASLQHLLRAASALAEDRRILVLGSASLLASFPALGAADAPLASTFDADLSPCPFDELTSLMLQQALGESRAYHLRHGYHADILRDSVFETFPLGWGDRLVPVPDCPAAQALDPHDLAAVKLFVGRPKDLDLLGRLLSVSMLDPGVLLQRIEVLPVPVEAKPRILSNYRYLIP